jgi:hypothetical protein
MDASAASCLVLGETVTGILAPRAPAILTLTPLFWLGVVILAARHIIWPRPAILELLVEKWRAAWRRSNVRVAWSTAIPTRVLVLFLGFGVVSSVGYTLAPFQFRVSHSEAANLPARFDAGWYLGIARRGYRWSEPLRARQQNIAFFPAFPALMRVGGDLLTIPAKLLRKPDLFGGGDARMIWGGVLVSTICFGFALQKLHRLVTRQTREEGVARRTVLLIALYPFSYFYGLAYSESTFLLAAVGMALAWDEDDLPSAARWGILAGLTRSNGWSIALAFLVDAVVRVRDRKPLVRLATALSPVAGALLFCGYIYHLTGNPFEWMVAQQGWNGRLEPLAFITGRMALLSDVGIAGYLTDHGVDALTVLCVTLMLSLATYLLVQRRWLHGLLIALYLLPALALNIPSFGRMTSVLFPAFIALSTVVKGWTFWCTLAIFVGAQVFLASRFFLWQPPF